MKYTILFLVLLSMLAENIFSQNCVMPKESDFTIKTLADNLDQPVQFALLPNGDMFIISMWTGDLRYLRQGASTTDIIGTVPTNGGRRIEDGALGIVADLNYAETGWIYVMHTPAKLGTNQISRFTVANGKLTNQKKILSFNRIYDPKNVDDQRHAAGGMAWDAKRGLLYISTGDDTNPFGETTTWGPRDPNDILRNGLRAPANTNDLRGKVLRIVPIPFYDYENPIEGVGTTYQIPEGNLFPVADYQNKNLPARPEIFTMGHRNPYRVKVDTVTGYAYIGEVGPDANNTAYDPVRGLRGHDEINILMNAGNYGWPFANADQSYVIRDYETLYLAAGYKTGDLFNLDKLQNLSKDNTGLVDLPPARPALVYYNAGGDQGKPGSLHRKLGGGGESATMGPTYNYSPDLKSDYKLPPYFHRKTIFGDYARNYLWLMTNDKDSLQNLEKIQGNTGTIIDIDMGPDGSIYWLSYGASKMYSLRYTGPKYDPSECSHIVQGCMDPKYTEYNSKANMSKAGACQTVNVQMAQKISNVPAQRLWINVNGIQSLSEIPLWAGQVQVYDVGGRKKAVVPISQGRVTIHFELETNAVYQLKFMP